MICLLGLFAQTTSVSDFRVKSERLMRLNVDFISESVASLTKECKPYYWFHFLTKVEDKIYAGFFLRTAL